MIKKKLKQKMTLGLITLAIVGTVITPTTVTVLASEINKTEEVKIPKDFNFLNETEEFKVINETTLYDNRDGYIYEFETNESMKLHMESDMFIEEKVHSELSTQSTYTWKIIDFTWFTKQEVKKLAAEAEKAAFMGVWTGVAAGWLWKFPFVGATVATISAILYTNYRVFVRAANNNQSVTHYREQRNQPDGNGPVYRSRFIAHN